MRKGVNHHTMRKKLKIRSVQFIFSVFMFVMTAGMTGCGKDNAEFLEKELTEEKEVSETVDADAEPEDHKDMETEKISVSEKSADKDSDKSAVQEVSQTPEPAETVPQSIYVDICGAVAQPGVYELSPDSRVFQAIEKAGGYLPEAAASYLNRARSLNDGQQIYVPTQEEVDSRMIPQTQDGNVQNGERSQAEGIGADGQTSGTMIDTQVPSDGESADQSTSEASRINLNTADVSQLTTLTGVGESKALAIIAYREENGPFTSVEDIMNVPGIKEGTYEKIKDKIAIE